MITDIHITGWRRADTGRDRIQAIKDTAHTDVCIAFEWPDGDFCDNPIHPERSKAFGVEIKTCCHECSERHRRNLRRVNDSANKARIRKEDKEFKERYPNATA